ARGSLALSSLALTLYWVGPSIIETVERLLLDPSPLSLLKNTAFITLGLGYIYHLALLFLSSFWMYLKTEAPPPVPLVEDTPDLPIVAVQIPIRHEPFSVVRRTIDSALALRYSRERLEIQVIDNSDGEEAYREVQAYCAAQGVTFI